MALAVPLGHRESRKLPVQLQLHFSVLKTCRLSFSSCFGMLAGRCFSLLLFFLFFFIEVGGPASFFHSCLRVGMTADCKLLQLISNEIFFLPSD